MFFCDFCRRCIVRVLLNVTVEVKSGILAGGKSSIENDSQRIDLVIQTLLHTCKGQGLLKRTLAAVCDRCGSAQERASCPE